MQNTAPEQQFPATIWFVYDGQLGQDIYCYKPSHWEFKL
jgi:hypothetical protein